MNKILSNFISDPYNDDFAFELAEYYYNQNQTASALSFYLRVTECSKNPDLIYESLLKSGLCFERQGNRYKAVKGLYLNAISYLPKRPEAYFLLSRFYERNSEHQECYMLVNVALSSCDFELNPLRSLDEYPGKFVFYFEKAISSWWLGQVEETIVLLIDLRDEKYGKLDEVHRIAVNNNIAPYTNEYGDCFRPIYYNKSKTLNFSFDGMEKIDKNYSQVFQDIFVLTALNGKTNGKYLEIGASDAINHSNTYLLESKFGWKGISLEIVPSLVTAFNGTRRNNCFCLDATTANYNQLLDNQNWGYEWDYLQLDCEPSKTTFETLLSIPFDRYKFAVITYEHDYYLDQTKSYREKSRKYLQLSGYELVVNDIAPDNKSTFEDWWVHPDLVDRETINKLKTTVHAVNKAADYILSK